jgi:hypothetical protein
MNSQPVNAYPDARIDQVLEALRTTESPAGLEQRIAARFAQATEARAVTTSPLVATAHPASSSFFAVILNAVKAPRILLAQTRLYTVAAATLTLLLAITAITLHHHHSLAITARTTPIVVTRPLSFGLEAAELQPRGFEGAGLQPRRNAPIRTAALAAEGISRPTPTDPDTIALAETAAPSHPAPPMPFTPQERLLFSATRQGQPIEVAELDLAREPIVRAAAIAHEKASLQQFARRLVSQLVTSESLDPTPHNDSHDNAQPATTPTSSSTNEPQTNGASPQ